MPHKIWLRNAIRRNPRTAGPGDDVTKLNAETKPESNSKRPAPERDIQAAISACLAKAGRYLGDDALLAAVKRKLPAHRVTRVQIQKLRPPDPRRRRGRPADPAR